MRYIICFLYFLFVVEYNYAQQVYYTDTVQVNCNGIATLSAPLSIDTVQNPYNLSDYSVMTIPYISDSLTTYQTLALGDDAISNPINLPFNFNFYGTNYNKIYISSNGWVGFEPQQNPTWVTQTIPLNTTAAPKKTIMAPWQDIFVNGGGNIRYGVKGTAPYRRYIIEYNNIPMFSCTSLKFSGRVILYESTNVIETHIKNKPLCTNWNSGRAVHGLHDGIQAAVVPGRNNTAWTATFDGVRFTPENPQLLLSTINWTNSLGQFISNNNTISAVYYSNSFYDANLQYISNLGDTIIFTARYYLTPFTATVQLNTPQGPVSNGGVITTCNQPVQLVASGMGNYTWQNSLGTVLSSGSTYTVPAITNDYLLVGYYFGCYDTISFRVENTTTLNTTITTASDTVCMGSSITLTAQGGGSSFVWKNNLGQTLSTQSNITVVPTSPVNIYTLYASHQVCSDTVQKSIYVKNIVTSTTDTVCVGNMATLVATGSNSYIWKNQLGSILSNNNTLIISPDTTTTYLLTGISGACSHTIPVNVKVLIPPSNFVSSVDSICPGMHGHIIPIGVSQIWYYDANFNFIGGGGFYSLTQQLFQTTTYNIVGAYFNGMCPDTMQHTIFVAKPIIQPLTNDTICLGSSNILTVANDSIFSNIEWYNNGNLSSISDTLIDIPLVTTEYVLVATLTTDDVVCQTDTNYIAYVNPLLSIEQPVIDNLNDTILFIYNLDNNITNIEWYFNNNLIPNQSNDTIKVNSGGVYHVVINTANGCVNTSYMFEHTITELTTTETAFNVYPNPTSGNIYIQSSNNIKPFKVSLYNSLGQHFNPTTHFDNNKVIIETTNLSKGLYHLIIYIDGSQVYKKISIQ